MMGNYILSGRLQAIASMTFSALISLLIPPFAWLISGSVLGLITLSKGPVITLQLIVCSLLILLIFSILAGVSWQLILIYVSAIWLPVWLLAAVLRLTEHQGIVLFMLTLLATLMIVMTYVVVGDVASWWGQWLTQVVEKTLPPQDASQYKDLLQPAVMVLNAAMVVGIMLNIFSAVLCARWWQARLFNPGAFQKEFHALHLPPMILPLTAVFFVLVVTVTGPWQSMIRDIVIVMMFMYLIQGIASVHRYVAGLKLSPGWLVAMYILLALLPQTGLLIACLGMMDIYINWRRKRIGSQIKH